MIARDNSANSPGLSIFSVPNSAFGTAAAGVDILLESNIPITFFVYELSLQNDDFGTRQFLYPSFPSVLLGDVNLDDVVDFGDIQRFVALVLSGEFQAEADIDQNGSVGFSDIGGFIDILLASPPVF